MTETKNFETGGKYFTMFASSEMISGFLLALLSRDVRISRRVSLRRRWEWQMTIVSDTYCANASQISGDEAFSHKSFLSLFLCWKELA